MRTKTLALSAVLGAIGVISAVAQTNVYSLNAVGYVTVTFPPNTYTMLTCPLTASPNNTLATILPNTNGQYKKAQIYPFVGGNYTAPESGVSTTADASGWSFGGVTTINPGSAVFFYNPTANTMTATFVGQVPQGLLTNALAPGYNLVGSIVPASGDLSTNPITQLTNIYKRDAVYFYDPATGYGAPDQVVNPGLGSGYNGQWNLGDPSTTNVAQGFFYYNANFVSQGTNNWVENFSVNP